MTKLDKALSLSLMVAIVAAIGYPGYVIASPKPGQEFTEFYVLNVEGKAGDYPQQIVLGEPVDVIIGIVNHEYKPTSYQVRITIDGINNKEISIGELTHGEKWQEIVSFTLQVVGEKQKVGFWLCKNDEIEPNFKDPLLLSIDVIEP